MYQENHNGILAGCLLGDGYLPKNSRMIYSAHTTPQRNYVLYKNELFNSLGMKSSVKLDYWKKTSLGPYEYSDVRVKLPNNDLRKASKVELANQLTPIGLLIWWMDDGSLSVHKKKNRPSVSRHGYLNTQSMDLTTTQEVVNVLESRFGFKLSIHKDSGSGFNNKLPVTYYRIYFNATAMRALIDVVRHLIPDIPKDMMYKFNMGYYPTRVKASIAYTQDYNFN